MQKDSIKKIIALYGSSILGVALGFSVSIFNSRVLGPESFGDLKFIESVARFIAGLVSVGFFISITRLLAFTNDGQLIRRYLGLFTVIFLVVSGIGIILMLAFSFFEPIFFEHGLDTTIRRYFFIVMVILGQTAMGQVLKGLHKIYTIAFYGILPPLIYLIIVYAINQITPVDIDYVLGFYYGVQLIIFTVILWRLKPDFAYGKNLVKALFEENRFNGRPIYYGSLAGVATTHLAGLSISYFMDNTQVGFFMLSITVCSPMLLIPSVLGTVYFKQFVTIRTIPKKVVYFSIVSTIAALIVFYSLIETVIVIFYGEDFLPVSGISKYIILALIVHGFGDLINRFLGAKGKGTQLRNAAFAVGVVNVLGYTLLIKYFDVNGAIITKILASSLYFALMLYYYFRFVNSNENKTLKAE